MALFFECMLLCAQKELDTADIVREAIFRQLGRKRSARLIATLREGANRSGTRDATALHLSQVEDGAVFQLHF
jgi:hypothetical protein